MKENKSIQLGQAKKGLDRGNKMGEKVHMEI